MARHETQLFEGFAVRQKAYRPGNEYGKRNDH